MNELPTELLIHILSLVNCRDLVTNCRLVCRKWKEVVDSVALRRKAEKTCSLKVLNAHSQGKHNEALHSWQIYYLMLNNVFARNLLKNNCGQNKMEFWRPPHSEDIGTKWKVEEFPEESDFLPKTEDFGDERCCFSPTSRYSSKYQIIRLKDFGLSQRIMDGIRPVFRIRECSDFLFTVRSLAKSAHFRKAKTCFPGNIRLLSTQPQTNPVDPPSAVDEGVVTSKNPLHHADYFQVHNIFTIEEMFESRVHLGHKLGSLDDKMKPFLFGARLDHLIFDLEQTATHLRQALNFTAHIAYRGGVNLFVGQTPQNCHLIERTARESGEYAHTRAWRIGTFTNSTMLYGAVTRLPDLCIFLNTLRTVMDQHFGVIECAKMLIPTVGVVDSNCDPNLITFPVPGNDDTPSAMQFYCRVFKAAILRGKAERQKVVSQIAPPSTPSNSV